MDHFTIKHNCNIVQVDFTSKQLCDAVGRLEFCSRLLYDLSPNTNAVWVKSRTPRINANILGFPKNISWSRKGKLTLIGTSNSALLKSYLAELATSITSIIGKKKNIFSPTEYAFTISDNDTRTNYSYVFDNRSRALVAFCVLWDGSNHPRDHLEVKRDPNVVYLAGFPLVKKETKTYGDPSKTIDELRNQGFPRNTDESPRGPSLKITRANNYGTKQEHYLLTKKTQSSLDRVGRSQIPKKYKKLLYENSRYVCNNCGQTFTFDYLSPDHRIPSIVKPDNLNPLNYMDVLQTLCVRCNQVKREACKKCPYGHQCLKCAWAYPETLGISQSSFKTLKAESDNRGIGINALIETLFK